MFQPTVNETPVTCDISLSSNEKPVQPSVDFPLRNGMRFTVNWYSKYSWLEYSVVKDTVFCYCCRHFAASISRKGDAIGNVAFVDYGYVNGKI